MDEKQYLLLVKKYTVSPFVFISHEDQEIFTVSLYESLSYGDKK